MRQIKFKVRFKIKQYNESFKKDEDIDRFTIGNYFDGVDSKDARDMSSFILDVFRDAKLTV